MIIIGEGVDSPPLHEIEVLRRDEVMRWIRSHVANQNTYQRLLRGFKWHIRGESCPCTYTNSTWEVRSED